MNNTIREQAIKDVKADATHWINDGTAVKGWYTCEITGKKFRGDMAWAQLEKQEADIQFMITMIEDTNMENEMDDELGEDTQHAAKMALVNAGLMSRPEREGKMVARIMESVDKPTAAPVDKGDLEGQITDALAVHLNEEADKGKNVALVTIQCEDCGAKRLIKPQDAFQVRRCEECQKKHRNAMRAQRRREKRAQDKEAGK